ncbi:ITA2 protein, partial [Amia calva]|nr:ITA2 protein [Amia calva]
LLSAGCSIHYSQTYNVGLTGAKVFRGRTEEQFGYTVQQLSTSSDKWLLVGSPWTAYPTNRMGDIYKCPITGSSVTCQRLDLQGQATISTVTQIRANMSLGLTLARKPKMGGFLTCGPLWAQQCGSQYFVPGICAEVGSTFSPAPSFSPAIQQCGGPMDIAIVLDGSYSIWPWPPISNFLQKLIQNLNIGPNNAQVSIIQYANDADFEFKMNTYRTKEEMIKAASEITQKGGDQTNTFKAIEFARSQAFLAENGARPGAAKVMVVVTDGESHDRSFLKEYIGRCERDKITRFAIAVLGYYIRNEIDTKNLIAEIKSIASTPTERYFFNVSAEAALAEIAGSLGERIFDIEGTGKGGGNFQMEMSQVGFSAHYSSKEDVVMLGAVGAYDWTGTVVHRTAQRADIFPRQTFEKILEDRNHSSLLGYSVTIMTGENSEYYVAGAPRSNHTGQVIVYTINSQQQPKIIDSQRGEQIGSYFGSVLCSVDVNKDSRTDVLLVGAPMFMSELKKEEGRVYLFSVTKGILSRQGFLQGPSDLENARFGMAITGDSDLNLDGLNDVIVGAPLEDDHRGVIYVYNGEITTIRKQHSQRILGSDFDNKLQYFGRSLDAYGDLNGDTIPDVSVGAYGHVLQLWSRRLATVNVNTTFTPDKINILKQTCDVNGRKLFCFQTSVCFAASFRPKSTNAVSVQYNLTLDADLQSSRVSSRGLFVENNERLLQKNIEILSTTTCVQHKVYVQEAPDFVNSIGLRVDIVLQNPNNNPVLDVYALRSWEFFIPFSKDCGADEVCLSDLVLNVKMNERDQSQSPMLVSSKNRRISFTVKVQNKRENAYNAKIIATYSKNLYFSSKGPSDDVKCNLETTEAVSCQVGYPALLTGQEASFDINFDFNFNQLQRLTYVQFEAQSDSKEEYPGDNTVHITFPVQYDSEIILTRYDNFVCV